MPQFSTFSGHADKAPRLTDIDQVYRFVVDPDSYVARFTRLSRQQRREGNDDEARRLKAACGFYVPSAVLEGGHGQDCLRSLSQYVMLDFDHIAPSRMAEVTDLVRRDPHTLMSHVTNSQVGVRIIARYEMMDDISGTGVHTVPAYTGHIPFDRYLCLAQAYHATAYAAIAAHYVELLGCPADPQTSNINRGAYYCYDPEAYLNADAAPFVIPVSAVRQRLQQPRGQHPGANGAEESGAAPRFRADGRFSNVFDFVEHCVQRHCSYAPGQRNAYICRCCYMLHDYHVPRDIVLQWVDQRFSDFPARERYSIVRSCCREG